MRIRMKCSIAGPGWSAKYGDVIERSDDEGMRLCESGLATPVVTKQSSVPESPVLNKVESRMESELDLGDESKSKKQGNKKAK